MFNGFKSKEELRDAIHEQNPMLTTEESEVVDRNLDHIESLIGESERASTHIMAGMVDVVMVQDYAFIHERGWRVRAPRDFDEES